MKYIIALSISVLIFISCSSNSFIQLMDKEFTAAEHNDFGVVFEKRYDLKSAIEEYMQAIRLDSSNSLYRCNLANVHYQQGDFSLAIKNYEKAIELKPIDYIPYYNLSVIYLNVYDEPSLAIKLLESAIVLSEQKGSEKLLFSLGYAHLLVEEYTEAISYLEKSINMSPTSDNIGDRYYFLSLAMLRNNFNPISICEKLSSALLFSTTNKNRIVYLLSELECNNYYNSSISR